jgi:hypothetical protein
MRPVLPSLIYTLPKRGFPTPIVAWLSAELGDAWAEVWRNPLPSPLDGLLNPDGVLKEFAQFRRWGRRMPNTYALAHRLVSLQTLLGCARTLAAVPSVSSGELTAEPPQNLPGAFIVSSNREGVVPQPPVT